MAKKVRKRLGMAAKDEHKMKMLEFWGNPDNDFITRFAMHTDILGITATTFYKHFTPLELQDIEYDAVELRKKNSSRERSAIYKALAKEGKNGNVAAAREFLDRTEGKVLEKKEVKVDGVEIRPIINVKTTGD